MTEDNCHIKFTNKSQILSKYRQKVVIKNITWKINEVK